MPPAPKVTSAAPSADPPGVRIYWRGSAGARTYSVQRAVFARGPWTTVCRRCGTDSSDGFVDRSARIPIWYRVIPYNLDGRPGPASKPRRAVAS